MEEYKKINDVLVHLFNEIWKLEEEAIITDEFKDISNNDMHIIEAVGLGDGDTMSSIAKKLNITAGSLTTSMNSLVNKKYVTRERSEEDRRIVKIRLLDKGIKAYRHHKDYHEQMTSAVIDNLEKEEIGVLVKTLDSLSEFFGNYGKN
ncbi:MAG: MarR family transcriptional regulator [Hespellia sp.]|nr:MarR family transcriptional regulator [Hespellia sp.]